MLNRVHPNFEKEIFFFLWELFKTTNFMLVNLKKKGETKWIEWAMWKDKTGLNEWMNTEIKRSKKSRKHCKCWTHEECSQSVLNRWRRKTNCLFKYEINHVMFVLFSFDESKTLIQREELVGKCTRLSVASTKKNESHEKCNNNDLD